MPPLRQSSLSTCAAYWTQTPASSAPAGRTTRRTLPSPAWPNVGATRMPANDANRIKGRPPRPDGSRLQRRRRGSGRIARRRRRVLHKVPLDLLLHRAVARDQALEVAARDGEDVDGGERADGRVA